MQGSRGQVVPTNGDLCSCQDQLGQRGKGKTSLREGSIMVTFCYYKNIFQKNLKWCSCFFSTLFICVKQKTIFLDRIKTEQLVLQAVNKAYDELNRKHADLSLQVKAPAQLLCEQEVYTQTNNCKEVGMFKISMKTPYSNLKILQSNTVQKKAI